MSDARSHPHLAAVPPGAEDVLAQPERGVLQLRAAAAVPRRRRRDPARQPERPEQARAGDRGDERDVDDVHRARLQHRVPARARRAEADPRHAAADGLLLRRRGRERGHEHGAADRDRRARGTDLLRDRLAEGLGRAGRVRARRRRQLRRARRRVRARDPELRVDRRVCERGVPAGRVRLVLRVRHRQRPGVRARHRRRAAAEAADRRAERGDRDRARAWGATSARSR